MYPPMCMYDLGQSLSIRDVVNVAQHMWKVEIRSWAKVQAAKEVLDQMMQNEEKVYGATTGFGALCNVCLTSSQAAELSRNLIRSHAIATGEPMPKSWVRAAMVVRVN